MIVFFNLILFNFVFLFIKKALTCVIIDSGCALVTDQTLGLIFVDNGLSFMGISIVCSFERLLLPEQRFERTDS